MTPFKTLALFLFLTLVFACKRKEYNPALIVTVVYQEKPVANPTVYLKYGGAHNPQIPLSQYDEIVQGDERGQAFFANLPEDDYFIYATANPSGSLIAAGTATASMAKKEAPNRYEIRLPIVD